MKIAVLITVLIGISVFGYYLMGKLDKFLGENRKSIEDESQKKEPSCIMLDDDLSEEEIAEEIRNFKGKHGKTKILLYDISNADASQNTDGITVEISGDL